jgi:hypothetical protein
MSTYLSVKMHLKKFLAKKTDFRGCVLFRGLLIFVPRDVAQEKCLLLFAHTPIHQTKYLI